MPKWKTKGDGIPYEKTANKNMKLAINRTKKRLRELQSGMTKASSAEERNWYKGEIARIKKAIKEMQG